jgi:hypothetical protein
MAWYLKGMPAAARIKDQIMEQSQREPLVRLLTDYIDALDERTVTAAVN